MRLAEIDEYDPSEEQFASSLAGREADEQQELSSGTLASARQRYAAVLPDIPMEPMQSDLLPTSPPDPDAWKQEVSSRIQNYKARRRRSLGDESLSFNFESTAGNHVFLRPEREPEPEPAVAEQSGANYYSHPYATAPDLLDYTATGEASQIFTEISTLGTQDEGPESAEDDVSPDPELNAAPAAQPEIAKLILFPKPPMMQSAPADQLAEPVFEVPRIVEANEAEAVTVPLADITLQPDNDDECIPFSETLELPVPVAPVAQRVAAEIVDSLLVLFATGLFATLVAKIDGDVVLTDRRTIAGLLILVPAAFWAIYKYLFLVHGGETLGMKLTKLRLVDFTGAAVTRTLRRHRALSMLISAFPLGLGLLWSFVDTESLCWHDRISRTYLTSR
jgi:uncharacterized RDD family membrane protein YckC